MTTLSPPVAAAAVPADKTATTSMMHALVYHGPDRKGWEEVPKPVLVDDTDAIVRVDATTICGSDLHILKGDVPEVTDGRILGHEASPTSRSRSRSTTSYPHTRQDAPWPISPANSASIRGPSPRISTHAVLLVE
jgi:hypothetical protein